VKGVGPGLSLLSLTDKNLTNAEVRNTVMWNINLWGRDKQVNPIQT
jgi:hypothetical protein